ncbi:cell division protein ZapE [Pelagibacterales bacterium SAG-MED31]|nr:cell division protein ZapE [Pelagibacterales bacterium SAG-MED31]
MSFTILDHYNGFVANNFIKKDINQTDLLKQISFAWDKYNKNNSFFSKKKKVGLYVYGSVGTGKTFLLSLFSQYSKVGKKIHFNHLMNNIHDAINSNENKNQKLEFFIKEFCKNIKILFIDELHIFNIVDALIVRKIFHFLEVNNIFVMTSSNYNPDDLYQNGLQRADFIPFIEHIKENYDVISIDSVKDYRRITLNQSKTYFTPINKDTEEEFNLLFERLVDINNLTTKKIKIKSREINFIKCSANVAYCNFDFICNTNLAHEDYANIAREFKLIFIQKVPKMTEDYSDQCRRFINLIDMLYDNKCSVVILAENPISSLCQINNLSKEFKRTASRLYEMTIIQAS